MRQGKAKKKAISGEYRGYLGIFMFFFTFFLIFLVVSSLIYIQTSKSHRERLEQEMLEGLTDFSKEWERCTQQIYEAGYKLLYNEAFGRLIPKENEAAGQQETIELIGWMELYAATVSDYASDVFLFYDDDYVITEEGMSDFSLYFDVVRKHGRYPADEWRKLLEKPEAVYKLRQERVSLKYSGNSQEAVFPLAVSRTINGRQVVLGTEVSAYRLRESFLRKCTMEGQNVLCMDDGGTVFFSQGADGIGAEEKSVLLEMLQDTPMTLEPVRLNGEAFLLAGCRGVCGLDFFLLTPQKLLREEVLRVNEFMLLFFLLTMVLFFILTLIYTRRIYHPLHSVAQKLSQADTDRWEKGAAGLTRSVPEEMERFWNRNRTILDFLQRLMEKSFDETVHSLLRGEKRDRELLADYLETAGVRTQRLGCFICQVDFLEKYYDEFQEGERELIEKNLPYLLYQMMDGGKGCCLVPDSNNRCICFFEWDEEAPGRLGRMAESVRELFAGDVDFCTIRCGLSARASAESRDIRRIVWEAETALRLAGGQADQNGFIREYDPEQVQFGILFGKKEKNRLVNFLAGGQEQKAHALLEDIVEQNQKAGLHEGLMQVLYGQLYHTGYEFLLNAGSESAEKAEQLWGQVLLMEENESAGGLTALKEFYSACIAMTEKSEKPDNTLEKVFAYITEHFAEGIYLENVAEAVTVSPKYLSRIFKERTGVNLSEYINLVRITRAKELLVTTKKGVGEIGEEVGFENRTTFFRAFKKQEGVSPNEYRKNARQ